MTSNISISTESLVWGKPETTPDNTGYAFWILFLSAVFICIAAACFHWSEVLLVVRSAPGNKDSFNGWMFWGFIELGIAAIVCNLAFSSNLRVDGFTANAEGINVAYSYTPTVGGDFINNKDLVPWEMILLIRKEDDGEGSYYVVINLDKFLVCGNNELRLACKNEFEADIVVTELLHISGGILDRSKAK